MWACVRFNQFTRSARAAVRLLARLGVDAVVRSRLSDAA
jgi:hypothetical protein